MTSLGISLVLAAAVCQATWNFFVKKIGGGPELIWLFSLVSVLLYGPVAVWILFTEAPEFGVPVLVFIAGSALLHLGYFLLLQTGYRQGDLSLVYPTARATGPLLSTALAVLLLGERVTLQLVFGALIVVSGVLILTGGLGRSRQFSTSLAFGLGAGLLIGTYTVWDAYAVSVLAVSPILLDYASSVGRTLLLAPVARRRATLVRSHWRNHRFAVLSIAVFNPLAYILVLFALTFTPVAYVAPTREVSVLLTVLAGSLLLGEGALKHRLSWSGYILIGIILLVTA